MLGRTVPAKRKSMKRQDEREKQNKNKSQKQLESVIKDKSIIISIKKVHHTKCLDIGS